MVKWLISGLASNRSQLLYYLFCLESAEIWTNLSLSCSSAGYQQNNSHVACFGYIYWTDLAENTTNYFLLLSSYISYEYISSCISSLQECCREGNYDCLHEYLLSFSSLIWYRSVIWSSKIFTDSFHLVCLPLLSNSWVNKTGSGRRKWDFISFLLIEITGEFGTRSALPGAKSSKQMGTSPTAFVCATEGSVLPKVVKLAGT